MLYRKYSEHSGYRNQTTISGWYNQSQEISFELQGFWDGYASALCCLLDAFDEPEHPENFGF